MWVSNIVKLKRGQKDSATCMSWRLSINQYEEFQHMLITHRYQQDTGRSWRCSSCRRCYSSPQGKKSCRHVDRETRERSQSWAHGSNFSIKLDVHSAWIIDDIVRNERKLGQQRALRCANCACTWPNKRRFVLCTSNKRAAGGTQDLGGTAGPWLSMVTSLQEDWPW